MAWTDSVDCRRRSLAFCTDMAKCKFLRWNFVLFCLFTVVGCSVVSRDKEALLYFKGHVTDPSQELVSWTEDTDPCDSQWKGVVCSVGTSNLTVQHLSLAQMQLEADVFPASLQYLGDLRELDVGSNNFRGGIPSWIGNLRNLTRLDFQNNYFTGSIPKEISQLPALSFLRFTNNSLTGTIPPELGNLSSLTFLGCDANELSGSIPLSLANLTSIQHFHLDNNQLAGSLPEGLGKLMSLIHIIANDNKLNGTLPSDLGLSATLQQLKLDNNQIGGQIPSSYGFFQNITDIRMRNNSLSGPIPSSLSDLTTLQVLDLGANELEGNMPDFNNLQAIVSLSLDGNNLSGPISAGLSGCVNLEILDLSQNMLSGTIPQDLGLSGNLLLIEIQNNQITGSIPLSVERSGLEFIAYENPLCEEAGNKAAAGCQLPGSSNGPITPTCYCPRGMIYRPFITEGQPPSGCDCVAPLVFELFFPRVLYNRLSTDQQNRLESNVARELYVETKQVLIVQPPTQNGSGTDVTFSLVSLAGKELDNGTIARIKAKLYAPFPYEMWLDGEFGWFNYVVELFIPPVVSDLYPPFPTTGSKRKVSPKIWVSCLVAGVVLLALSTLFFLWLRRRRKQRGPFYSEFRGPFIQGIVTGKSSSPGLHSRSPMLTPISKAVRSFGPPVRIFSFDELSQAAGNFSSESLIGSGGFGAVYKGQLPDGTMVAVKKLSGLSRQGEAEFRTEIEMIAHQLHSPYLVRLRGYCSQGEERLLVYDLMARGSLLDYLRDGTRATPVALLDWNTRTQIARDAAAGLRFLHESNPPVVHRDIKPSNILLDEDLNARVADFGLSKLYPFVYSDHVTTRVVGTFGYLAPDYSITGKLTVKSDVYSFGVVLLEILSGRHSTVADDSKMEQFLVPWAKPLLQDKKRVKEVIDPALEGAYSPRGLDVFASLVSSCLQLDPDRRPNMGAVHNVLTTISDMAIPVHMKKAKEQREALLSKKHSFRLTNSDPSLAVFGSGHSGGRVTTSSDMSKRLSSISGLSSTSKGEHSNSPPELNLNDEEPPKPRRTLSFSTSGRHAESPARLQAPTTLVPDSINPR